MIESPILSIFIVIFNIKTYLSNNHLNNQKKLKIYILPSSSMIKIPLTNGIMFLPLVNYYHSQKETDIYSLIKTISIRSSLWLYQKIQMTKIY